MFIVGGTFNKEGGKPSHIVSKIMETLKLTGINGGTLESLNINFTNIDTLIWMPNIDNTEDKILPEIKKANPHMLLIQSKRAVEKDYSEGDVVGRLLQSHALLGIIITKPYDQYRFRLMDPLGNSYCDTYCIEFMAKTLEARVNYIKSLSRVGSSKVGEVRPFTINPRFIDIIQESGTQFARFVNAVNPNRLLGNASTRCSYGFPAEKQGDRIFVTRRNVNKRTLSEKDFVEVRSGVVGIEYFGDNKPSVDTPVQVRLFNHYPNIKYMIHGHVYVEGARITDDKIPCGFLEEFEAIQSLVNDDKVDNFAVNLRGHGCIIACKDLDYFDKVKFVGRPFPEGTGYSVSG